MTDRYIGGKKTRKKSCKERHRGGDFNEVYLKWCEEAGGGIRIKFGDTRTTSKNKSNYRSKVFKIRVHGNNKARGLGKRFEKSILSPLVGIRLAERPEEKEEYVVREDIASQIIQNWRETTEGKTYLTNEDIERIEKQKLYFMNIDRLIVIRCGCN